MEYYCIKSSKKPFKIQNDVLNIRLRARNNMQDDNKNCSTMNLRPTRNLFSYEHFKK